MCWIYVAFCFDFARKLCRWDLHARLPSYSTHRFTRCWSPLRSQKRLPRHTCLICCFSVAFPLHAGRSRSWQLRTCFARCLHVRPSDLTNSSLSFRRTIYTIKTSSLGQTPHDYRTSKLDLPSSQLYSLCTVTCCSPRTAMFPTGAFSFFNAGWRPMLLPPPPPSHRRNPPSPQGQRFPLPFCVQPKDASTPPTLKMMNDVWETMPEDKEQVEETLTGSYLYLPH